MITIKRGALGENEKLLYDSMSLLDVYNLKVKDLLADLRKEFNLFYSKAINSTEKDQFSGYFNSAKKLINLINYIEITYDNGENFKAKIS